jgi:hypothetical protein
LRLAIVLFLKLTELPGKGGSRQLSAVGFQPEGRQAEAYAAKPPPFGASTVEPMPSSAFFEFLQLQHFLGFPDAGGGTGTTAGIHVLLPSAGSPTAQVTFREKKISDLSWHAPA